MRSLYEKAKRDQWNASSDIDWDSGLAPDCGILPDGLIDIYGTPYWDRMSAAERLQLNRHFSAWRISQLMYGEQFALMVCGQIANAVPGIDAKFFMATQVMDEAPPFRGPGPLSVRKSRRYLPPHRKPERHV